MKRILILAASLAAFAMNAQAKDFSICSGSQGGVYHTKASGMAQAFPRNFNVTVQNTNGSMENLRFLTSGECDAAIVQADAYSMFSRENAVKALDLDRVGGLHSEYVHMLCNKDSGITDDGDIESKRPTIAIGKPGSGAWVTWKNWEVEDEDYQEVKTVPFGGLPAVAKVADGAEVDCMMMVSGIPSATVTKYDAQFGEDLTLVSLQDKDFNDTKDPKGNKLYHFEDIPTGTYPSNLQTGFFGSAVGTTRMEAILIINNWLYGDEEAYMALLEAYTVIR